MYVYVHVCIYKCNIFYLSLHYTTLHYINSHYTIFLYITLHYTTLHYTTLHYTTLHYTTLHSTTQHYITPHYIKLHYITLFFRVGSTPPPRRSGVKTVPTSGTRLVGSLILEEAPPLSILFGIPEAGTSVWEVVTSCRQSSTAAATAGFEESLQLAGRLLVASEDKPPVSPFGG